MSLKDIKDDVVYCYHCKIGKVEYKVSSETNLYDGKFLCMDCIQNGLTLCKFAIHEIEKFSAE